MMQNKNYDMPSSSDEDEDDEDDKEYDPLADI